MPVDTDVEDPRILAKELSPDPEVIGFALLQLGAPERPIPGAKRGPTPKKDTRNEMREWDQE